MFTDPLNPPKEPDYGELWDKFKAMQNNPELKQWQRKVYVKGQHHPVNEAWADREILKQEINNLP